MDQTGCGQLSVSGLISMLKQKPQKITPMKITYYGHSCFGMEISDHKILFDPFITPNELAKDIDIGSIEASHIMVSHGHQDHVADLLDLARQTGAKVVSNFEIVDWLENQGIDNTHAMNHGGKWKFDFGTVKYVNAVHSSMLPDGSNGGNPGGFVVETPEGSFYYAGDTALTMDMQLTGRSYDLKFVILPVGDNFTMGIDDAVIAANFLKCKHVIAMHYDTFEAIKVDKDEARRKFRNAEVELRFMDIGETREI